MYEKWKLFTLIVCEANLEVLTPNVVSTSVRPFIATLKTKEWGLGAGIIVG